MKFFTLAGSKLPLSEMVKNNSEYPVLLQLAGDRIYALNFSAEYLITKREQSEHGEMGQYQDFARGIGFKNYELFSLPYFSDALMNALPQKKELTKAEVADSMSTVLRFLGSEDTKPKRMSHTKALARRTLLSTQVAET